jgi:hypothetical protein
MLYHVSGAVLAFDTRVTEKVPSDAGVTMMGLVDSSRVEPSLLGAVAGADGWKTIVGMYGVRVLNPKSDSLPVITGMSSPKSFRALKKPPGWRAYRLV